MGRKKTSGTIALCLMLPLLASFLAPAVNAKEYIYGAFFRENHALVKHGLEPWLKDITERTNGEVSWALRGNGAVVNIRTTLKGIGTRIVDAGLVVPIYVTKQLAPLNIMYSMQLFSTDSMAITGASTEAILMGCPECKDTLHKNKVVLINSYSPEPHSILCNFDVNSIADLKGKKIRSSGATSRLTRKLGGVPVSMGPSDALQLLERGALDCTTAPITWMQAYGFIDVTKTVIMPEIGGIAGAGFMTINKELWDSWPEAHKKAILAGAPMASARVVIDAYLNDSDRVVNLAKSRNIKFVDLGDDLRKTISEMLPSEKMAVTKFGEKLGVKTTEQIIKTYSEKLEKWTKISQETGRDTKKFAAALQREVYDNLTLDSF